MSPVAMAMSEIKRKAKARMMSDLLQSVRRTSMREIAEQELEGTGYTMTDLRSDRRTRELSRLRWRIWTRCRRETEFSLPSIGRFFGKDHTTVANGIARYEEMENIL